MWKISLTVGEPEKGMFTHVKMSCANLEKYAGMFSSHVYNY